MIHDLKIWPEHFIMVQRGLKCYEVRKDDRDFQLGDFLKLREYDQRSQTYTGMEVTRRIHHIYRGDMVIPGHCVLGL